MGDARISVVSLRLGAAETAAGFLRWTGVGSHLKQVDYLYLGLASLNRRWTSVRSCGDRRQAIPVAEGDTIFVESLLLTKVKKWF